MTTQPSTDATLPRLWHIIALGSTDPESKGEMQQMYSGVAELYHESRPRYPEDLVDEAIQKSKLLHHSPRAKILEIGCGPGTLTVSLAKRRFDVVAIDPGVGMIEKAKQVCKEYTNVEFRQESFKEFSSNEKYDAIVAASSLHWALAEDDKGELVEKMSNLLKDNGTLLLFWNFPPQPRDPILDKMAEALEEPTPFYFGNGSLAEHWQRMQERVLAPVEDSPFFGTFETTKYPLEEKIPIESYINFLSTLSNYITMKDEDREAIFEIVRKVFRHESGDDTVATSRVSILNISTKMTTLS